jgi:hypothetical protein
MAGVAIYYTPRHGIQENNTENMTDVRFNQHTSRNLNGAFMQVCINLTAFRERKRLK